MSNELNEKILELIGGSPSTSNTSASKMLQRTTFISGFHSSPLARQRANRILRLRYGAEVRPRKRLDPAWLPAHD